jgi:hypothetical protein
MSAHDESTNWNELDEFLDAVQEQLNRFSSVREAGVEVMVPVDTPLAERSDRMTGRGEKSAGSSENTTTASEGCNCPDGMRCVRLFPSGRRVCVNR